MRAIAVLAPIVLTASAHAQEAREHETIDAAELRRVVERGGLQVVAIEPGNIMVSDGKGFPARLSLAGCDVRGQCRVVRIYTRCDRAQRSRDGRCQRVQQELHQRDADPDAGDG